jgi:hypothetical protein
MAASGVSRLDLRMSLCSRFAHPGPIILPSFKLPFAQRAQGLLFVYCMFTWEAHGRADELRTPRIVLTVALAALPAWRPIAFGNASLSMESYRSAAGFFSKIVKTACA